MYAMPAADIFARLHTRLFALSLTFVSSDGVLYSLCAFWLLLSHTSNVGFLKQQKALSKKLVLME